MALNNPIKNLLREKRITKDQYCILFKNKKSWYTIATEGEKDRNCSQEQINRFNEALKAVIAILNQTDTIDLSRIHFPKFTFNEYLIDTSKEIIFRNAIFHGKADFSSTVFNGEIHFDKATFSDHANFSYTTFNNHVNFHNTRFNNDTTFYHAIFKGKANFMGRAVLGGRACFGFATFHKEAYFGRADFKNEVIFGEVTFLSLADFQEATFGGTTDFSKTTFSDTADFNKTTFSDTADFSQTTFAKLFSLDSTKITKLDLKNSRFDNANLLGISAYNENNPIQGKVLTKTNFANRETARFIKAHFDKQNNITESNKYFALEQEYYLDELKDKNSTEPNKFQTIITLYLNKYVSHFGTDWLRSLLILLMTGYLVMMGYMGFDSIGWLENDKDNSIKHFAIDVYSSYALLIVTGWGFIYVFTHTKEKCMAYAGIFLIVWVFFIAYCYNLDIKGFSNYIVQLTNPIGAFKDIELYKGIELYAAIVRITIAIIIYQLIVAFRNNTRRS